MYIYFYLYRSMSFVVGLLLNSVTQTTLIFVLFMEYCSSNSKKSVWSKFSLKSVIRICNNQLLVIFCSVNCSTVIVEMIISRFSLVGYMTANNQYSYIGY